MATIPTYKKYSSEELTHARRNGFKTKKPAWWPVTREKAPKKTEANIIAYKKRYNDWVDKVKANAKEYKSKSGASGAKETERLKNALKH